MHKNAVFSKDFILVAVGQIISIFGNQILRYALPLYLLNLTGSSVLFGTILAVSFVPMILLYPVGGIIADRINKKYIMVTLDFATAILIFLFYLMAGRITIVPLMAVTMMILYGIQGAYQPAVKASVPALVEAEHRMAANSIVDMINSAASMAGPVIGGLLFSVFGLLPILYISMACFLTSAVMELFIRIPFEEKKTNKPNKHIIVSGLDDLKESFDFIFSGQPVLWKISLIFAASNLLLTSLIIISLPVLITQRLGFEPDAASRLYGCAQGVIAAGAVLGGLLAGILSKTLTAKASPILLVGCCLSILTGGLALQVLKTPFHVYLVLVTGCGLLLTLHTLFQIQMMTYLQLLTPANLIGKVISCFMCVVMCTSPLGQFMYGFIFEHTGAYTYLPFYIAAVIMAGISIAGRRLFYDLEGSCL